MYTFCISSFGYCPAGCAFRSLPYCRWYVLCTKYGYCAIYGLSCAKYQSILCTNPWIVHAVVAQTMDRCWCLQFIAKRQLFHSKHTNNYLLNKNMCFTSIWAWIQLTSLSTSYWHPIYVAIRSYTQLASQLAILLLFYYY